jgi:hypothetical protein
MTLSASTDVPAWAIPPKALREWLALSRQVETIGTVPCRTSDPEAWWPDRKSVNAAAAQMAIDACCACRAMNACLTYALAADEREGIWGATLPDERRGMQTAA